MKKILTIILFVGVSLVVSTPSAFAQSAFDAGGVYNPLQVQVEYSQSILNQQKENSLKSTYGLSNYYSCASGGTTQDLSNPSTMERYLNTVQYCLESKSLQSATAASSCPQGYVVKNGACVTPDAGCKSTYGQYAKFDKYDATTGYPVCGCYSGYEWSTGGDSCMPKQSVNPSVFSESICMLRQNTRWNTAASTCDCLSGFERNEAGGDCSAKISVPQSAKILTAPKETGVLAPASKKAPDVKNIQSEVKEKVPSSAGVATSTEYAKPKSLWVRIMRWFGF